ncbi:hypothetical protein GTA08_BOTSDO08226 [Botryosphaeria dothidea]|uniref:Uncharacterized protein n=1 Tax=Botryosphaeria dothidea TaxID=55169 RepID=A0A8H4IP59_9PEZI|nr:hypothetical protein GTA08_BOTSDO08226 [Botryosphaeria dothidea]
MTPSTNQGGLHSGTTPSAAPGPICRPTTSALACRCAPLVLVGHFPPLQVSRKVHDVKQLSFIAANCCFHRVPESPVAAHGLCSKIDIRTVFCDSCVALISALLVSYYAKDTMEETRKLSAEALAHPGFKLDEKMKQALDMELRRDYETLGLAIRDVRRKQLQRADVVFSLENSRPIASVAVPRSYQKNGSEEMIEKNNVRLGYVKSPDYGRLSLNSYAWIRLHRYKKERKPEYFKRSTDAYKPGYHTVERPLDTSGWLRTPCRFYHFKLSGRALHKKHTKYCYMKVKYDEDVHPDLLEGLPPLDSSPSVPTSSAALAAALLCAALTFSAPPPSSNPSQTAVMYQSLNKCHHEVDSPRIDVNIGIDQAAVEIKPQRDMCAPCAALAAAERAWYAAILAKRDSIRSLPFGEVNSRVSAILAEAEVLARRRREQRQVLIEPYLHSAQDRERHAIKRWNDHNTKDPQHDSNEKAEEREEDMEEAEDGEDSADEVMEEDM